MPDTIALPPTDPESEEKSTLENTLDTINNLYAENSELQKENNEFKKQLFNIRASAGIGPLDTPETIAQKLRVLNNLRLCGILNESRTKIINQDESLKAIPYLIESLSVEQLEYFVETMSTVVAFTAAHLKGSPIIKIRREQKAREAKESADRVKSENESKSPKAKAEKRQLTKEQTADEKAIRMLTKSGMSEDEAKKMVAKMKGHN